MADAVVCIATAFWMLYQGKEILVPLLGNLLLFKMFVPKLECSMGGQMWFISTIIQFYLAWPLIVKLINIKPGGYWFALFISLSWATIVGTSSLGEERVWNSFFLQYLWEFCLGMKLAELYREHPSNLNIPKWIYLIPICVIAMAMTGIMDGWDFHGKLYNDIPSLIGYTSLALIIYKTGIGIVNRFFCRTNSFSCELYLVHILVFQVVNVTEDYVPVIVGFAMCLFLSYLWHGDTGFCGIGKLKNRIMEKVKMLNTAIQAITEKELLRTLKKGVLVTPNVDHLMKLQRDREFYNVYKKAEWVVCDSKILYLLSKLLKHPLPEAIPGSSFFTSYYMYHKDDPDCKIFLLGAKEGVAAKAMERINKKVGRKMVVGAHSPSFGFEKNEQECRELVEIVNRSGANVLLVGVGAPKQEKWIMKYRNEMPSVDLFMALGATIDFEAGNVRRAPRIFQKLAMEWLYRFLSEPRRMFKRYFVDDMQFFFYFAKQLLGVYKDPFVK